MFFVCDNLSVLFVALVASLMGWLFGGTRSDVLLSVAPWLLLFLVQILFVFPQKHSGETTYEARTRIWAAIKHDPVFWVSLGFLALLAIPFANNGLCVNCDHALIALGHDPSPPVKFLPFCVNRLEHLNVFLWFATALACLSVVRHCLVRRGKRLLVKLLVWNGFALALLGFIQTATGAVGPLWQEMANVANAGTFFSTFGYPNMAGDYFTTLFGFALALWRDENLEIDRRIKAATLAPSEKNPHRAFWRRHQSLIPAVVFYFAAISTLSRAAIILINVLLIVIFVHCLLDITKHMHRKDKVRKGTIAVAVVGLVAFFAVVSMPENVQNEINTLNTDAVLTRVTGKGQYHTRVANEIWHDNVLFGCGGWGYKHFCVPKMTSEELKQIQKVGGINVHNDYLQFLAEHGLVGFGALVAIVVMMLWPVVGAWRRLIRTAQFTDAKKAPAKPIQIFALPASVFFILLTLVATFIHGFGDCPLRSPAVLTLFFISLGVLPGFLPKE